MRRKYQCQVLSDVVMLFILLSLMGFHLWSEYIHEWLGTILFLMVMLHVGLNTHWLQKLFQGEYCAFRLLQLSINALLLLLFLSAVISGVMLSRHLLPDLVIHSSSDLVRKVHMASVHWLQIIIALHLGIHWRMLANFFCKIWHISPVSVLITRILPLIFSAIAVYGIYAFIQRERLPYLLFQVDFAFFDFDESMFLFYWDFFAITLSGAYLSQILIWLMTFRQPVRR
ncbi:DUF4405 domain-containing protein [Budviciaceae bacterium CWB-B4]|uniref:DUF4405 domain-containing protein n=1 Tax=Limnobaculum xujianqingii TaxID=2738837 RepID=A0A9D7FX87_9GAMM|nr:DUF4405 domain-containing protein [Limnobaculum xujianqingii]MBK5072662.1 DUF4405 domain-containing protein [Limnobaculum xujianqingii]MBK5175971.1 DUF4405 domain-containing protein [Limnobaculum xujianqingii]